MPKLSEEHRNRFDDVIVCILPGVTSTDLNGDMNQPQPKSGAATAKCFMLDAPGGTGKTFLTTIIFRFLKMKVMTAYCASSSAVAAQLLPEGRTAHSIFKLLIPCDNESTCYITVDFYYALQLKASYLIVWNEIFMSHRHSIEAVDNCVRDLMKCPEISFGGKCVLYLGDFRQILSFLEVQDIGLLPPASNLLRSIQTSRYSSSQKACT